MPFVSSFMSSAQPHATSTPNLEGWLRNTIPEGGSRSLVQLAVLRRRCKVLDQTFVTFGQGVEGRDKTLDS